MPIKMTLNGIPKFKISVYPNFLCVHFFDILSVLSRIAGMAYELIILSVTAISLQLFFKNAYRNITSWSRSCLVGLAKMQMLLRKSMNM